MWSKLNSFIPIIFIVSILLYDSKHFVFTQNNTEINRNATNDDFVYDYVSSDNEKPSNQTKTNETVVNVSDDYVYDYVNVALENTTTSAPTIGPQQVDKRTNITSSVTYDDKEDESEESSPQNEENTTSNNDEDKEEDLGYDEDDEDTCDNESVLTKMLEIHEQNKNKTKDYNKLYVNHINQTFERLKHIQQLYEDYFAPKKGFGTEMLAFVSSIDIVLTPECFASFFSLISGFRNNKLWANKCEFGLNFSLFLS